MRRGKKSPSPAQPHRKAKIRRRQPLSPSLLQPGDPCRPPEAAQFSESLGRGLGGAVRQQPSRKKHAKRTLSNRGQKERMQNCLPPPHIPSRPSGEGAKSPNKATSTILKGPVPYPHPSQGNPTLDSSRSFTWELRGPACKDDGVQIPRALPCRLHPLSPSLPALPLASWPGLGEAG